MAGPRQPALLLDGSSEFVLTYKDKDGDWMLVGDVPWEYVFFHSASHDTSSYKLSPLCANYKHCCSLLIIRREREREDLFYIVLSIQLMNCDFYQDVSDLSEETSDQANLRS